ncbi:TRAP transporter small permease [Tropicimonas sediminicola]|uniref:TRAP transporter small permease protein n=1 Tax=Tropicimonas sediminicola TaxID=1031541 RepID=A0A239D2A0_9RHOB|nr:TRAP transporter small permease subunit [Tropicimonas sediminicola]SNS26646.1 TRAP-type C4-dicarboxylate transport system, small permease component [Tropicimonas sediminicola]
MLDFILKIDSLLIRVLRVMAVSLLCLLFVLLSLNVILRFFPVFSMGWFDEIVELSFAWIVFATAAVLWRNQHHPKIDLVEALLEGTRAKYVLLSVIECINIFFLSAFTWFAWSLVVKASAASPVFQIPRKLFYVVMPAAGLYMTVVSVFFLVMYLTKLFGTPDGRHLPDSGT